jgi:hypothetical protein
VHGLEYLSGEHELCELGRAGWDRGLASAWASGCGDVGSGAKAGGGAKTRKPEAGVGRALGAGFGARAEFVGRSARAQCLRGVRFRMLEGGAL